MPNALAFLVIFSFPVVVVVLFWKLPVPKALVASIFGGYLFLPSGVAVDLPVLPALDKTLIPSLAAVIMCLVMTRKPAPLRPAPVAAAPPPRRAAAGWTPPPAVGQLAEPVEAAPASQRTTRGRTLFRLLFAVLFLVPILTVLQNPEPIIAGPRFIPGLKLYDIGSLMMQLGVTFVPFWLAQRYLARPEDQVMLLYAFVLTGLGYSLLCLYEVRMSPQINRMLYGFYPHDFLQHIRNGGYRPMVFLRHGLWVGIYLAMTVLAAATLFLWSKRNGREGLSVFGWAIAAIWLLIVLLMSKTLGAFSLTLLFLPVLLMAGVPGQLLFAMIVAGVTLFYPLLRGAGLIPVDTVYAVSQSISQDRADSLKFRLDNEDALLERAAEKPLSGWGSWGRNLTYNKYDGNQITTPDGAWIIVIGAFGWVGYLSHFGILTAPLFLLGMARRRLGISVESSGLALVLAINLLDLIPNATLTPLTYMVAGALAGRYALAGARPPETATVARGTRAPKPGRGAWPVPVGTARAPQTGAPIAGLAPAGTTAARPGETRKYRQPRRRPE